MSVLVAIVVIACNNKRNINAVEKQRPQSKTYECDFKPPKWYKGWMRDIEEPIANHIYNYLVKNKAIIKEYRCRK